MPGWNGSTSSTEEMAQWPHTTGQGLTQKSLRSRNLCSHFNSLPLPPWAYRQPGKPGGKKNMTQMANSPYLKESSCTPTALKQEGQLLQVTGTLESLELQVTDQRSCSQPGRCLAHSDVWLEGQLTEPPPKSLRIILALKQTRKGLPYYLKSQKSKPDRPMALITNTKNAFSKV